MNICIIAEELPKSLYADIEIKLGSISGYAVRQSKVEIKYNAERQVSYVKFNDAITIPEDESKSFTLDIIIFPNAKQGEYGIELRSGRGVLNIVVSSDGAKPGLINTDLLSGFSLEELKQVAESITEFAAASPLTVVKMKEQIENVLDKLSDRRIVESYKKRIARIEEMKELVRLVKDIILDINKYAEGKREESIEDVQHSNYAASNASFKESQESRLVTKELELLIIPKGSSASPSTTASPLTLSQYQKLVVATIQIIQNSFSSEVTKKRCSEIIDNVNSAENLEGVVKAIDVLLKEGADFTNSESVEIEKAILMDMDHWGKASKTLVVIRNSLETTLKKGKNSTASPLLLADKEKEELNNIIKKVKAFNEEYISWVKMTHLDQFYEEIKRYMNTVINETGNDVELEISKIGLFIKEGKLKNEKFAIKEWEDLGTQIKKIKSSIKEKMLKEFQGLSVKDKTMVGKFNALLEKNQLLQAARYVEFFILHNDDNRAGEWWQLIKEIIEYRLGSSSSITSELEMDAFPKNHLGGIDLTDRAMRIKLERVGSFASSALVLPEINNVETLDLDKEFEQIQAMVNSSIRPSDTRILEFAAACYYKGEFDQRLTQITDCIKNAHIADEGLGRESSEPLRLATMLPDALYGG